jgi:Kelch motif protein/galactose oxidase-like protein
MKHTLTAIVAAAIVSIVAGTVASAAISVPVNTWVKQPTPVKIGLPGFAGSFDARGWNHMLYDPVGKRMVIYDGYVDASRPSSIYANALWMYNPVLNVLALESVSNWVRQAGATVPLPLNVTIPTPYDRHSYSGIAIAPDKNRLYMWGGANNSVSTNYTGDTWVYDFATKLWHEVPMVDPHPYTYFEQAMVYDQSVRKMVIFGGPTTAYHDGDRAWTLDVDTERWQPMPTSPQPAVRMSGSMVYDPVRRVSWLFGGGAWPNPGNDLWAFTASTGTWQQVVPSGAIPAARRFAAMAYDSRRDVVLMWGGVRDDATSYNDTWLFRPATRTWQQLSPTASPPGGFMYSEDLAYDGDDDVFILHKNGEFWLYRVDTSGDAVPPSAPATFQAR